MDIYQESYDWLIAHLIDAQKYSGGELRVIMGNLVENFVDFAVSKIQKEVKVRIGSQNPITVVSKNGFSIQESVDRHLYVRNKLIAAIECKTYLDKCYLQRADSDFHLLKTSNNFTSIVLSLQNAVNLNSEYFFLDQNNIDKIFYLSDVKRASGQENHISQHLEWVSFERVKNFIEYLGRMI